MQFGCNLENDSTNTLRGKSYSYEIHSRIIPNNAKIEHGEIISEGKDLLKEYNLYREADGSA